MNRRAYRAALSALLLWSAAACTNTRVLSNSELAVLKNPPGRGALVISTPQGKVQIEANTELRFQLASGRKTRWLRARSLKTNERGVFNGEGDNAEEWSWNEILDAEVRNFSGAKTLGLLIGTAAVVATVVAIVIAADGMDTPSTGNATGHLVVAGLDAGSVVVEKAARKDVKVYTGAIKERSSEEDEPLVIGPPNPLFSGVHRRRSVLEVVPTLNSVAPLLAMEQHEHSAALSLRLRDFWEVGFVARAAPLPLSAENIPRRFVAAARVGANFELDEAGRFAVPLLFDIGGGSDIPLQTRLNIGLRVRVSEFLSVGLFPANPTFTVFTNPDTVEKTSFWSIPSGLELALVL